jgi:hypothetical protein
MPSRPSCPQGTWPPSSPRGGDCAECIRNIQRRLRKTTGDTEGSVTARTCENCTRDVESLACRHCATTGQHQFWLGADAPKGSEMGAD